MLQAHLLSYPDAHRYRIGINYAALDVNKPRCPVHSYHRDGQTRFDGNGGGTPVYQPNSFDGAEDAFPYQEPPLGINGDAARYDHWQDNQDYYIQAGNLYRLMDDAAKARLISNLVGAMQGVPEFIQQRQVEHFLKADPAYGVGVAKGLGINVKYIGAVSRVFQ